MSNSLIARVKQYRARHGCTLKEAHDAVTAGRDMEDFSQPLHPPAMPDEITRLTALAEHLKADRIRISEEAEAEIARLKVERDAAKAAGRLEGLEEAAKVAEREGGWRDHHMAHKISAAIRALKEKQP